jgi:hypothetical protein
MRDHHRARGSGAHVARVTLALTTLAFGLAGTSAALGDLAPPAKAPPVAKRRCVKYTVVRSLNGPAARCLAYKTETLHNATSGRSYKRPANGSRPTSARVGASNHRIGAFNRSPAPNGSPSRPASHATPKPSHNGAAPTRSSTGTSLGVVVAIIAASALAGAALVALMRRPLVRWRNDRGRGTAS